MNELTRRLKSRLVPGAGLLIPGAANALAGRIIAGAGFEAVYLTGAGVANSHLGAPDIGLTSVTELAEHVAALREAVEIPIVADGDTGFGNALNMRRTVRLYERAGANAIQIEDQLFPKRCGHFEGKSVVAKDEMVQKIKAAVDARQDGMLVLARTDARAVEGFPAAVERMLAYREAGADLLFIEAPVNEAELAAIPKEVPGAHIYNMVFGGKTPMLPREKLAALGFAGILYANALLQASMIAMKNIAAHLKDKGSLAGAEASLISFAGRQELVDHARYQELEKRYVGS
jgi:2-methylisocitrate lyase-like PEP mutase family enzyme